MTGSAPSFTVQVDVTNPGQFFACCGLLELAHRLWPGAEGWFPQEDRFAVFATRGEPSLTTLLHTLAEVTMSGLSEEEQREREALEAEMRELKGRRCALPDDKEVRRKQLGEQARAGSLRVESRNGQRPSFSLLLEWWQAEDEATPKTWAGRQEIHRVARAAQEALSGISAAPALFDYGCVMTLPGEYVKKATDQGKSVEPFFFDSRRFAHALDAGFSLDAIGAEAVAHPAVELLALIGLQRFRPSPASIRWHFGYWTWRQPLCATVAAGVVGGTAPIPERQRYRFPLRFRDDQKRYKAFGWATAMGDAQ